MKKLLLKFLPLFMKFLPIIDIILIPIVYPAAMVLKSIRSIGVYRFPHCKKVLLNIGVFPIRNHYYEPQFDYRTSQSDFSQDRKLPGIDWNVEGQLKNLEKFTFANELAEVANEKQEQMQFYLSNGAFSYADAGYWYQIIRATKPKRIIEIGSGNSTLMAIKAIRKNCSENPDYKCDHQCIEPYEMPWLEKTGVTVIRKKVEDVGVSFFAELQENDILFIDSSHIIRPQGDVNFEYLEVLPTLRKGVIVHVHDICSPKNYPQEYFRDAVLFWNEQYLLEAFLTHNSSWTIYGAISFLHNNYYGELKKVVPFIEPDKGGGSFYIRKTV